MLDCRRYTGWGTCHHSTRPDWQASASLALALGAGDLPTSAAAWLERIAAETPGYQGLTYQAMAEVREQWPLVGGEDLYFGGTSYENRQGLGVALPSEIELGGSKDVDWPSPPPVPTGTGLLIVPVHRLYDRGTTVLPSRVLDPRRASLKLALNPADAAQVGALEGSSASLSWDGRVVTCEVALDATVPPGVALVPRSAGAALVAPVRGRLGAAQPETA